MGYLDKGDTLLCGSQPPMMDTPSGSFWGDGVAGMGLSLPRALTNHRYGGRGRGVREEERGVKRKIRREEGERGEMRGLGLILGLGQGSAQPSLATGPCYISGVA